MTARATRWVRSGSGGDARCATDATAWAMLLLCSRWASYTRFEGVGGEAEQRGPDVRPRHGQAPRLVHHRRHRRQQQGAGQQLAAGVVSQMFEQRPAESLCDAAHDLAFRDGWIDQASGIAHDHVAFDLDSTRFRVHLHDDRVDAVSKRGIVTFVIVACFQAGLHRGRAMRRSRPGRARQVRQ